LGPPNDSSSGCNKKKKKFDQLMDLARDWEGPKMIWEGERKGKRREGKREALGKEGRGRGKGDTPPE
jgi:hypothetical protein